MIITSCKGVPSMYQLSDPVPKTTKTAPSRSFKPHAKGKDANCYYGVFRQYLTPDMSDDDEEQGEFVTWKGPPPPLGKSPQTATKAAPAPFCLDCPASFQFPLFRLSYVLRTTSVPEFQSFAEIHPPHFTLLLLSFTVYDAPPSFFATLGSFGRTRASPVRRIRVFDNRGRCCDTKSGDGGEDAYCPRRICKFKRGSLVSSIRL
ncbi:hypothetical protein KM043_016553 [Ampulex compressa]|nr:hypothetical protein KM043_016553 [Ampulex compressa]